MVDRLVEDQYLDKRLDIVATELFIDYSRSQIKQAILAGDLKVDGKTQAPRYILKASCILSLTMQEISKIQDKPESIILDIVYSDEHIIILNKPVGLVVHPGAGNATGTMMNALLNYDDSLISLPRCGIVHRLDKDTSGIMVVARSSRARQTLVEALSSREVKRIYRAVCQGMIIAPFTVDKPIGRHMKHRTKMAINPLGKEAVSHFRPLDTSQNCTLIEISLETGRTHQIRVHAQNAGHSLVGDKVYRAPHRGSIHPDLRHLIMNFLRQALHAYQLTFCHPVTAEEMSFTIPIPADIEQLWKHIKKIDG